MFLSTSNWIDNGHPFRTPSETPSNCFPLFKSAIYNPYAKLKVDNVT